MWQKSRNWKARLGLALGLALVACSVTYAQDVRTNYMPGTDFSKYPHLCMGRRSKGRTPVGGQPDQILDTQVKQAVDSQMAAKGLTKVDDSDKSDLLLGYQPAIDREKQINGFGDNWEAGGARGAAASIHFRRLLQAITSGLSSLVCMTLLKRNSFG